MKNNSHSESKSAFQLERFILFSDAVFAIAITLLVLEIRVPEIERDKVSDHTLLQSLAHILPKFIGFFMSFFIIGLYWTVHHHMFGYVVSYTTRLLWLNLFFLLGIVLMPFSTAFYSEYIYSFLKTPMIIYVCNISFIGFMNFALYKYIGSSKRNVTAGLTKQMLNYFLLRAITVPAIFIMMALVYIFISPRYAVVIPPIIPLLMRIVFRKHKKRLGL